MTGWQRLLARWGVPFFMGLAYLALVVTSDVSGIAKFLLGIVFCVVLFLWSMFRELTLHGSLSRAASVGDADELHATAIREVEHRNAAARAPFQVYLAIAHYHRGEFDRAADVLAAIVNPAQRSARQAWLLPRADVELAVLTACGKTAEARTYYADVVVPLLRGETGIGAGIIARQSAALSQFLDEDFAGAREAFVKLVNDVRLGPAARAIAGFYAGRCAAALGDAATAAADTKAAAELAPQLWFAA